MYSNTTLDPYNWNGLKKDVIGSGQKIKYGFYLVQDQKGNDTTEATNSYSATTTSLYDPDAGYYTDSDSAASVYSLLGVSPLPSKAERVIPWEDYLNDLIEFKNLDP
ncbi:HBL272Wp [Eremothecium sinecaudum]|uniref:HBL272Wp n=1 Tax=Eremothecium sinecaudum TaxID=45286 RepID=A0A120K0S4_9SACH|nr:HBL272Wp [Eremothecium sinecaudum]AMD18630.1 HBL272Wp [Eremothecium sinecaudum]